MVLVPDEMVTIEPPPPAAITGMAWRASRRAPARRDLDRPLPDAEIDADRVRVEPRVAPGGVVVDRVDRSELGDGSPDELGDRLLPADVAEQPDGTSPAAGDLLGH